jgi:hypothetical protein
MADGVFRETVNLRPINATSGAASGLLSLADRISAFGDQTFSFAAQELTAKAQARGKESAALTDLQKKGGITQAPELKEEHFIGGIEIKSHNKALRAAYLASLSTDIRDSIGRIQQDHPDDVIQFNEKMNGLRKGIMSGVEPAFRQEIGTFFDSKAGTAGLNVRGADIQRQHQEAKATIEQGIETASVDAQRAARNGDNLAAAEGTLETIGLFDELIEIEKDPAKKQGLIDRQRDVQREVAEQSLRRGLDVVSLSEAQDILNDMDGTVPKGWEPDEWDTFIKSARSELRHRKTIEGAVDSQVSDATERDFFGKLLEGRLTAFDIKEGEFDSEEKRTKWLGILNSQSASARAADVAKASKVRSERNDLHTQQQRATAKVETAEEETLDDLYSEGKLTDFEIDKSDASTSTKRTYRNLVKARNKLAESEAFMVKKDLAEDEIERNIGQWTPEELDSFLERGLTADEVHTWKQRNQAVIDDPSNYKNNLVFKQGNKDLLNAKKNYLFIGGSEATDLAQDDINTQRYLNAIREYDLRSSEPGADPVQILSEIKQPFIDEATKSTLDKFFDFFRGEPEAKVKFVEKSDDELLKLLGD